MRIGIDAKWFYRGPVSTQTVLSNLLPTLFTLYPEHEWIIFLDKKDKDRGFEYISKNVTVKYVWGNINMLSNIFVLPKLLKKLNIELIVYQTFPGYSDTTPSISFIHDVLFRDYPEYFTWKEKLYFIPLCWVSKFSSRLMTTTTYVAKDLVRFNYTSDINNIDIVPLGVSKIFKPIENHGPDKIRTVVNKYKLPQKYILYVGRLNARKNIEALIKSLPHIQKYQMPLVIVGEENWKTSDLDTTINSLGLQQRIIFTGKVSNEELPAIYAASFLFCFPSFAEGFGLPPLEAMASGIPVIVSNTTSMPEVCADAALYIDPGNPLSISETINRLINDETLYLKMKQASLNRAHEMTWENTARKFMNSISKAVKTEKK